MEGFVLLEFLAPGGSVFVVVAFVAAISVKVVIYLIRRSCVQNSAVIWYATIDESWWRTCDCGFRCCAIATKMVRLTSSMHNFEEHGSKQFCWQCF